VRALTDRHATGMVGDRDFLNSGRGRLMNLRKTLPLFALCMLAVVSAAGQTDCGVAMLSHTTGTRPAAGGGICRYPITFLVQSGMPGDPSAVRELVDCCAVLGPSYRINDGSFCLFTCNTPQARQRLEKLARGRRLLIPSCDGSYIAADRVLGAKS
jgi:hypothetical protein